MAEDARAVLGVGAGASQHDIDAAYKALVLQHHPDAAPGGNEHKFYSVQAAYATLTGEPDSGARARIPMRRTVPPGTQEHKVITLHHSDGTTVRQQVWIRSAKGGGCNVFTSPYDGVAPDPPAPCPNGTWH